MDARSYIGSGRVTVPGWFDEVDGWAFLAVNAVQVSLGVEGDLLEIGVYQGRSAILLGYLTRPAERVIAIDLFEAPPPTPEQAAEQTRFYSTLTRDTFEHTYGRFHRRPPLVLEGRSDQVMPQVPDRSVRFVHVDGSHSFHAVRSDIDEAIRVASDDAVIAFDDVLAAHTPGVTAAVWEAALRGRIVPLGQSQGGKLYATIPGSAVTAGALREQLAHLPVGLGDDHEVLGWPVLELQKVKPSVPAWKWVAWDLVPPGAIRAASWVRRAMSGRG